MSRMPARRNAGLAGIVSAGKWSLVDLLPLLALGLVLGCPSRPGGKDATPVVSEAPKVAEAVPAPASAAPAPPAPPVAPPKARGPKLARLAKAPAAVVLPAPRLEAPAPPAPVAQPTTAATPAVAAPSPAPAPATAAQPPAPEPATRAALKAQAKAKASYRRLLAAYGAQMGLVTPTNGGLRLAAGGPSVALGVHLVWNLPKGLRLRPRLDYTVFAGETRTSTAAPLPQTLNTRVSSLALGADFLVPLGPRWSVGLAVSELRWSVASTNLVTPTLGGSMTLSGTSHWTRLGLGPVVTFKVSDHLEVEARALSSHYGYENQPANSATVGLLWRF